VWDHFIQLRRWEDPLMEGWMMLSFLAAATDRIRLGTLVTGVTYRHPAILVKQASTLDVLSAGRSYFGVGAAWNEREHKAFGVPFPSLAERFEKLEELLQIAKRTWAGETGSFRGSHVQLTEQMDNPPPVQRPHPPILIGGGGERKTLRMVAQYANATHQTTSDPATMRQKMAVLRDHCERLGRSYDDIERFCGLDISAPGRKGELAEPGILIERIGALADAGAQGVFFVLPALADTDSIERFGEVIATVGDA
jgi:F420-dependent oxidoreductase-like protein